ncbi:hypothetical protein CKAH01_08080 [Colletotrichum kahawae]|uniref:Uncharacterized protein n=1 Tax=Colletotrichum kahawae TaxID=34407 RepID=A0AAD9Y212_COLKA|nr:hypothetical protein CKAH01_08080 [Colletotrichum kahawae]
MLQLQLTPGRWTTSAFVSFSAQASPSHPSIPSQALPTPRKPCEGRSTRVPPNQLLYAPRLVSAIRGRLARPASLAGFLAGPMRAWHPLVPPMAPLPMDFSRCPLVYDGADHISQVGGHGRSLARSIRV